MFYSEKSDYSVDNVFKTFSCFSNEENHSSLDKYFTTIFSELLDVNMFYNIENSHEFEKNLPAFKSIPLPKSVQVSTRVLHNYFSDLMNLNIIYY